MMNVGKLRATAVMAVAMALAGCQGMGGQPSMGGPGGRPVAVAPQTGGVEGEWMSTDGSSLSRFSAGSFETVAADTGNRLAEGTYLMSDQSNVAINMRSLVRQSTVQVNCLMATPALLNCTSASGQQFSLARRGAA